MNKNFKRILAVLLCVGLIASLAACGKKDAGTSTDNNTTTNQNTTTPEAKPDTTTPEVTPDATPEEPVQDAAPETTPDAGAAGDTMGSGILAIFKAEVAKGSDIDAISAAIAESETVGMMCDQVELAAGAYMPGLTAEITNFTQGKMIVPFIGSIPFVCYVFQSDDAAGLATELSNNSDPRWNICTEAAETVSYSEGNWVLFTMCPGDDF